MNYIVVNDMSDFQTIIDCPFLMSITDDLAQEIDNNMWAISISQDKKKMFSLSMLKTFVQDLIKKRKRQLQDAHVLHPVVFYMWFDEVASQLRFNIISYKNKKLPFGCRLNFVESVEDILESYVNDKGYISWQELVFLDENGQSCDDDGDEEEYILDIFVQELN